MLITKPRALESCPKDFAMLSAGFSPAHKKQRAHHRKVMRPFKTGSNCDLVTARACGLEGEGVGHFDDTTTLRGREGELADLTSHTLIDLAADACAYRGGRGDGA